jgi:hypothetical protein
MAADRDSKRTGRRLKGGTATLRAYASNTGTFTTKAARQALGLSARALESAVDTLLRGKRLRRVARATYEWISEKKPGREAPLEERIWHAMRINPAWSCADIAQQAGTTTSYVYKRLRVYRAAGYVKRHGVKAVPGGSVKIWRLAPEASRQIELPRVEEYSPEPLVVLAVRLNKLICTGLTRFVDERRDAVKLCNGILRLLSESENGEDTPV